VFLPKLGKVPAILHREFTGTIKTCTVSKETTGKYFISVLTDDGKDLPNSVALNESEALGIDVGLKDFATLSDGRKVKNPCFLKRSLRRLKRIQRSMVRKTNRASANYGKAKVRRALLEERVANQRKDFLHQFTHHLVCESQVTTFCVEDLSIKNMMGNRKLARAIVDVSWGEFFRQLKYKAAWHGKNVLECCRFDPSSKTCGFCGFRLESLKLEVRKWECPCCGVEHDRDLNAAANIVRFAFAKRLVVWHDVGKIPLGQPELQACGYLTSGTAKLGKGSRKAHA
jgi:putative transposase